VEVNLKIIAKFFKKIVVYVIISCIFAPSINNNINFKNKNDEKIKSKQ
tara:strand:- start:1630 stop:1773 length:144 start_codon:yes stop_codon:yes gene_type:complete